MFRASLCPSSGEQECALPHMVFCTGNDGCGCMELGSELCALWRLLFDQCRTPYAAVHSLVLLMMGIMMPETCWDKSLIINVRLVASCWFLSLQPTFMMHGHTSLKKCINWSEKFALTPRSTLFYNLCLVARVAFYFVFSVICIVPTSVYDCSCLLCAVFEPRPPDGNPISVNKYRVLSHRTVSYVASTCFDVFSTSSGTCRFWRNFGVSSLKIAR